MMIRRMAGHGLKAGVATFALIGLGGAAAAQQAAADDDVDEIVITADRPDSFGADYVQAGSFRGARQIDTPLTVSVIPETLLRAQQANGLIDALRNSAGVVASQIAPSVYSNLTIRGITVENRGNYRLNGTLPIINLVDLPLENKFRVEALKGASSLYYGFTTPGGIINLTSKRPTEDFYLSTRFSGNNHGQAVASAEVSDTWGMFGARLTGVVGSQDFGVKHVEGNRHFFAGAFDLKPVDGLTINLDIEQIYKKVTEPTQLQLVATAPVIPALLEADANLGDKWLYATARETNILFRMNYEFTKDIAVSVDLGQSRLTRTRHYSAFSFCTAGTNCGQPLLFPVGQLAGANDGIVTVNQSNGLYYRNRMARTELAARFDTGPLEHNIVLGYSYNKRLQEVPATANSAATEFRGTIVYRQNYFNRARLYGAYSPPVVPGSTTLRTGEPALPPRVIQTANSINDQGYYIFDRIEIGDFLQLLGGARKTDYKEVNELTGALNFKAKPTSYSGSVVVKPTKWISVYGSYIEGLETTPAAPNTALNAFAFLPASPSKQYEGGIKVEPIKSFLITAAAFQIDRTQAGVNQANVYEFISEARFKGLELSATGELTADLSLYLTALFLDPKQRRSGTPAFRGKLVENTPKRTWSAAAEYRLPMVTGLAVTAGAYYTGRRAVNAANLAFIPGYTLFDIGGSYSTEFRGNAVVFRVNAENVTGKKYYAATGSSLLGQGLPAVVKFSIETTF